MPTKTITLTLSEPAHDNLRRLAGGPLTVSGIVSAVGERLTRADLAAVVGGHWPPDSGGDVLRELLHRQARERREWANEHAERCGSYSDALRDAHQELGPDHRDELSDLVTEIEREIE